MSRLNPTVIWAIHFFFEQLLFLCHLNAHDFVA